MKLAISFTILLFLAIIMDVLNKKIRELRQSETATWQSAPTDGTVFKYIRPGKTEVVLYYENGEWHVLKEDAK